MANLAIVGTHSTNGVAAIHSELLRTKTVADFAAHVPRAVQQQDQRRHPAALAAPRQPGPRRRCSPTRSATAGSPTSTRWAGSPRWPRTPRSARHSSRPSGRPRRGSSTGSRRRTGIELDPDSIFDTQIKRIHEYKRQLLNVLHVVVCYNRLRANPGLDVPAPDVPVRRQGGPGLPARQAHHQADQRRRLRGQRRPRRPRAGSGSSSCPNYSVTLAESLIPASDVSEQISTAGYEASGTSNMKFMMNGALTVGTRDGATIEIAEEAGEENVFLFGLTADQVAGSPGLVRPPLALRARGRDPARPRPDLLGPLQPRRAGALRADPGRPARRTATTTCTWPT